MRTITIVGIGYVGISNALVLAKKKVFAVDIDPEKIRLLNKRRPPVRDSDIKRYFSAEKLNLTATADAETAYKSSDFVVVAVPTNYDEEQNNFDTAAAETVIGDVTLANPSAVIVIKSIVPVGFTAEIEYLPCFKSELFQRARQPRRAERAELPKGHRGRMP